MDHVDTRAAARPDQPAQISGDGVIAWRELADLTILLRGVRP